MAKLFCFIILFSYVIFININCLQVIPERINVTYVNEKYLHNATANVRRYGRQSGYYINVEGSTKHTWGNNVTIHMTFFEYLHNEYKRSFVEMHFKGCDLIRSDPYLGRAIANITDKLGLPCPAPAGVYRLMNISIPMEDFPNVWPFEKCKVDITFQQTPTKDIILSGEVYLIFKQKLG